MASFDWYIDRLMAMEPGEVPFRLLKALSGSPSPQTTSWDTDAVLAHRRSLRERLSPENLFELDVNVDARIYDQFLSLEEPPDWFRCPKTGRSARESAFKKEEGRRNQPDIRYLRELNRMQFLLPMYLEHRDDRKEARKRVMTMINDWIQNNPPYEGINWTSGLEASLRLYQWGLLFLLFDDVETSFLHPWLDSINHHMTFVSQHFSRFSSANNHLIGEASGLFVASLIWPAFDTGCRFFYRSKRILEEELRRQFDADGWNREQSSYYHAFSIELLLYPLILERVFDRSWFSDGYRSRLRRALSVLHQLNEGKADFPLIGDHDGGQVLTFTGARRVDVSRLLGLGGALFDETEWGEGEGVQDKEHCFWGLHLPQLQEHQEREDDSKPVRTNEAYRGWSASRVFDSFTRLRNRAEELELLFLHGSTGYRTLATHGHADALSFLLYAGGEPVFIDPGAYTYHGDRMWRDYFRGTTAHNTLSIGGVDQARSAGRFIWRHQYHCHKTVERRRLGGIYCQAQIRGYRHTPFSAVHSRSLKVADASIKILDRIRINQSESFVQSFHLHPEATVRETGSGHFNVTKSNFTIHMSFSKQGKTSIKEGSTAPPSGWCSGAFEEKQSCPTLVHKGPLNQGVTTLPVHILIKRG